MGKKGFILPLLLLLAVLSSCLISLPAARAQLGGTSLQIPTAEDVMKSIIVFIFGSEFPDYWLTYSGFMQYIIFPFLAVFVVMYGILSELRIFHHANVKAVLSLVMAFVGGSWALQQMRWFLLANALWGTFAWGILMITGIALWIFRGVSENVGMGYKSYKSVAGMVKRSSDRKKQMDNLIIQIDRDRVGFAEATGKAKGDWNNRLNAHIAHLNRLMEEEESEAH